MNGLLFFAADDGIHGRELWKTDGSEAGTTIVKDIHSGSQGSFPLSIINHNGNLFFNARDVNGQELWKSDGTEAGTVFVKDINPGGASSIPQYFASVYNTLYFQAADGVHGEELWKTDGTPGGTVLVQDILPGPLSSWPREIEVAGRNLFVTAYEGQERFRIQLYAGQLENAVAFTGKVFLQGAYNPSLNIMNATLNSSGILQSRAASQPYSYLGYQGNEKVADGFFAANPSIIDWVLVELRDPLTPSIIVARRAAFVMYDGTIVDIDGNSEVIFDGVVPGNYYISVRHRNHLGVRSASTIDFSSGKANYDFTLSSGQSFQNQNYSSTVKLGDRWVMRGGNASFDNSVKYNGPGNDQNYILNTRLAGALSLIINNIYAAEDLNMDGTIKWNGPANDQNVLLNSILGGSLSMVFIEQL